MKFPLRTVMLCAAMGAAWMQPAEAAETSDPQIAELKAQIAALTERLARVEARPPVHRYGESSAAAVQPAEATGLAWYDTIKLKGDFRYRHETIDPEFSSSRDRQRIRARTELTAKLTDRVNVGMGLATGGDDPVSTNQTLGEGASTKDIRLDLAYAQWETPFDGLSVRGGKFKNPLHRAGGNGLVWDGDFRPEGASVTFERGAFFAQALGLWVDENSSDDDTIVFGGQAGWRANVGPTRLLIGASYYDIPTKGEEVTFDGDPRGNSVNAADEYLYDYNEAEAFAELGFDVAGHPVTLFANYVHNTDADEFDTGYALGGKMKFSGRRDWQVGYVYQDLDADAVFALFTDSDFIGGGTDGKGHRLTGSYALTKQISLGGTLFINERGGNAGPSEDYDRLMLDVQFKY